LSVETALRNYRVAAWVTGIGLLILVFVAAPELIRAIYRIKAERTDTPTFTTNWGK